MRFFAHRTDANQPEIIAAFRKLGCTVAITSSLGNGFPDLVVGKPKLAKVVLVEVKDEAKPPSARELTDAEKDFRDAWAGAYAVVTSLADVVRVVKLMLS
jgi:hypothetical protein